MAYSATTVLPADVLHGNNVRLRGGIDAFRETKKYVLRGNKNGFRVFQTVHGLFLKHVQLKWELNSSSEVGINTMIKMIK